MVTYDGENHSKMVRCGPARSPASPMDVPPAEVVGAPTGEVLVVGWGSTYGAIAAAVDRDAPRATRVSHLHLRYLNPLPRNTRRGARTLRSSAGREGQLRPIEDDAAQPIHGVSTPSR
jgi:2-oxoglutarate/2-oxoacid ferredoxin oxidoreductase subunit alpha